MNVRLTDPVYLDLRLARDWCDEKKDGLGDEYADLFFRVVRELPHVILHHAVDATGYRPMRMPRFTAVIYFDLSDTEIVVVGLLVNGRSASNLIRRG